MLGVGFGPIPFGQFVEELDTRLARWNTMPSTFQEKQLRHIYKYLAAHGAKEASDEQWNVFSGQVTRLLQLTEASLDQGARSAYQINQVAKRELCLEENLGFFPLLLRGPKGEEAVVSTQTFDCTCGADARAYRLGLRTFSDKGAIDLTDCSGSAFSAIVTFLSGEDITTILTVESIENVFAKAHLWNARSLQIAVVKGCEWLLDDLLAQTDTEPARQFVETVIDPIALLDDDTQEMMLPLLLQYYRQTWGPPSSLNLAKYADFALKYKSQDIMQEICSCISFIVNDEPPSSTPRKLFSLLKELAVVQEQYPDQDLVFSDLFLKHVFITIVGVLKDKICDLYFRPGLGKSEHPFQVGYVFGKGRSPDPDDVPSQMRNEFMALMNREGISSLIRVVTLEPYDDVPSTRTELEEFLRMELESASNATGRPPSFHILLPSEHHLAPSVVDHYTELCKSLATAYAPLRIGVDQYPNDQ